MRKAVSEVMLHKANMPKRDSIPICHNAVSRDGKMISTDLEVTLFTPTEKPEGIYRIVGKEFISSPADAKQFPMIPDYESDNYPTIVDNSGNLLKHILYACKFVSKEINRPMFTGVSFTVSDGSVKIAATDGKLIYQHTLKVETRNIGLKYACTLPIKSFDLLKRDKTFQALTIQFDLNRAILSNGNIEILSHVIEGRYVDYTRVLPTKMTKEITFNRLEWISKLEIIKDYVKEVDQQKVLLHETQGVFYLSGDDREAELKIDILADITVKDTKETSSKDYPNFVLIMPLHLITGGSTKELNVAFSQKRMLELLKCFECDTLKIGYSASNMPMIITEK